MLPYALRPFQTEAIKALKSGRHVICVAPTGTGKSLIYEQIASISGTRTLLVTPLRALARQQVAQLEACGVFVIENGSPRALVRHDQMPTAWVVSPERLFSQKRGDSLSHLNAVFSDWRPDFLVVDEAHCLWEWGESFRAEFREISELLKLESIRRSAWFSATLVSEDREELKGWLPSDRQTSIGQFDLNERLRFSVAHVPFADRLSRLARFCRLKREANQGGVVFAQTRESTHRIEQFLTGQGLNYVAYHAGRPFEEKLAIEKQVASGELDGIIATSAFGMGVDCPFIDWVLLFQVPPTLTALAQAIGRTARGDRSGEALLWWENEDFRMLGWQACSKRRARDLLQVFRFCQETKATHETGFRDLLIRHFRGLE